MPHLVRRYAKSFSRGLRHLVKGGSRSVREAHRGMVGLRKHLNTKVALAYCVK
jgi:hypothetical protein